MFRSYFLGIPIEYSAHVMCSEAITTARYLRNRVFNTEYIINITPVGSGEGNAIKLISGQLTILNFCLFEGATKRNLSEIALEEILVGFKGGNS